MAQTVWEIRVIKSRLYLLDRSDDTNLGAESGYTDLAEVLVVATRVANEMQARIDQIFAHETATDVYLLVSLPEAS